MPTIRNVRACQPVDQNSPDDWRTSIGQILVAIDTDNGLTGFGVGGGGRAGLHVIDTVLKDLLIGRPVETVEDHWKNLSNAILPFGPEGIATMALSGLDLALWDIRGKLANQPIATLLNSEVNLAQPIPIYQTVWENVPEDVAQGNCSVKLHLGESTSKGLSTSKLVDQLVKKVERAREAIGPNRKLMVDAWMKWDLETTLRFAAQAEPYRLEWIEEPLPLNDRDGYATLSRECPIPIAGGEHVFTANQFQSIIEHRLQTILQPDVCWVGGLTELVKIYEMAKQPGFRVIPHRGAELWSLHAIAALSEQPLAESGRPWMSWVGGQPKVTQGTIQLLKRPGLGVDIDESLFSAKTTIQL
ncbi:mandelate racemase/muconate lactonizing enzyme family protein [Thalassoglobus polymorphus]|uniref:L-rhamnonate dehydratase n=1 Tax=Thalassoglobus polymorphus TaxID=2527994 RepID=A0A517QRS1_9PLAN|nr:mandelate racemase/muconate lactonizing enzyme family protein [Thalassoglobus polymorphus]QDT34315.1 L-rhamnonate dehydratase [Thalassoglobus polymorphus]